MQAEYEETALITMAKVRGSEEDWRGSRMMDGKLSRTVLVRRWDNPRDRDLPLVAIPVGSLLILQKSDLLLTMGATGKFLLKHELPAFAGK